MQRSHKVWIAVNDDGPWPCHRCGDPVQNLNDSGGPRRGVIHHDDRVHANDAPDNLRVMHHACHMAEHHARTQWDLAELIGEQIRSGQMRGRLPSLLELTAAYGVAPMTMRKALAILAADGTVIIMPSRGTFVAPRPAGPRDEISLAGKPGVKD